eukprot:TRINITY_DN71100_c0_g1_i1.p1 TRINITY_DN71100_c0_g1~~TRINITY_DN71100_c0_g1_i1.p1  ORF type:complete len:705 (+),score=232.49 TRINITY_DN71100_c0_g1_i1:76-2190(+)
MDARPAVTPPERAGGAARGSASPTGEAAERSSSQGSSEDSEDGPLLSPPFSQGVIDCLYHLRTSIEDVSALDESLGTLLRDTANELAREFEMQVMMMFSNWEVAENRRRELLRREKIAKDPAERLRKQAAADREAMSPSAPKSGKLQFDLDAELEAERQRAQEGPQLKAKQRSRMQSDRVAHSHGADGRAKELRRSMATTLSVVLRALVDKVQAQRASLYLFHRTSSTLRSVVSSPDLAAKQVIIPSHTGAAGNVFTSGVAFNIGCVDEHMQSLCKVTDQLTGVHTKNLLAFPVIGGCAKQSVGVLELQNKANGSRRWTEEDEFTVYHTAQLLHQIITQYPHEIFHELDLKTAVQIGGAVEANIATPDEQAKDLDLVAAAEAQVDADSDNRRVEKVAITQNYRAQLVFRTDATAKLLDPGKVAAVGAPVVNSTNLKEVHSYLTNLEESYRSGLNQYVTVEKEKSALQEELQRKIQRIRVLDENVAYLDTQLRHVKAKDAGRVAAESADAQDSNYRNFQSSAGDFGDPKGEVAQVDEHGFSEQDQVASRGKREARKSVHADTFQPAASGGGNAQVDFDFPGLSPLAFPNTVALVQRMAQAPPPGLNPAAAQGVITTSVPPTSHSALPNLSHSPTPLVGAGGRVRQYRKAPGKSAQALAQAKADRLGGGFTQQQKEDALQSISAQKYKLPNGGRGHGGGARIGRAP